MYLELLISNTHHFSDLELDLQIAQPMFLD